MRYFSSFAVKKLKSHKSSGKILFLDDDDEDDGNDDDGNDDDDDDDDDATDISSWSNCSRIGPMLASSKNSRPDVCFPRAKLDKAQRQTTYGKRAQCVS